MKVPFTWGEDLVSYRDEFGELRVLEGNCEHLQRLPQERQRGGRRRGERHRQDARPKRLTIDEPEYLQSMFIHGIRRMPVKLA